MPLGEFLEKLGAASLEVPEQVISLTGEALQLMGEQLERFAGLLDRMEQTMTGPKNQTPGAQ
jgi:hypothetical protein